MTKFDCMRIMKEKHEDEIIPKIGWTRDSIRGAICTARHSTHRALRDGNRFRRLEPRDLAISRKSMQKVGERDELCCLGRD